MPEEEIDPGIAVATFREQQAGHPIGQTTEVSPWDRPAAAAFILPVEEPEPEAPPE